MSVLFFKKINYILLYKPENVKQEMLIHDESKYKIEKSKFFSVLYRIRENNRNVWYFADDTYLFDKTSQSENLASKQNLA